MDRDIEWCGFITFMAFTPLSLRTPGSFSSRTLIHALKDCPTTHAILTLGGLDNRLLVWDYSCCIDWIKDIIHVLDKKVISEFITRLWNCWNNHNNYVFRGKEEEAMVVWDRAKTLCQDFRIHNLVNKLVLPVTP
ncbi:hypothetical protein Gohar_004600, partial [Gossypium harknessii]|nr:hypothetical protein [Gossypium harknessii]